MNGKLGYQQPSEKSPFFDTVSDEVEEVSQILTGSDDLSAEVQFSRDENPIYDTVAASEAQTLLRNSSVTFRALNRSFKKNKIRQLEKDPPVKGKDDKVKPRNNKQTKPTPPIKKLPILPPAKAKHTSGTKSPGIAMETEPGTRHPALLYPAPRSSGVPKLVGMEVKQAEVLYEEAVPIRGALNDSKSPGITRLGAVELDEDSEVYGEMGDEKSTQLVVDHDYEEIELTPPLPLKSSLISKIGVVSSKSMSTSGDLYTNPEEMMPPPAPVRGNHRARIPSDSGVKGRECLAEDGEKKPPKVDVRPPKPPRAKRKKDLERRTVDESDGSKQRPRALKPGELLKVRQTAGILIHRCSCMTLLQDYSTLLRDFRIFFIKLPTGVIHIELVRRHRLYWSQ